MNSRCLVWPLDNSKIQLLCLRCSIIYLPYLKPSVLLVMPRWECYSTIVSCHLWSTLVLMKTVYCILIKSNNVFVGTRLYSLHYARLASVQREPLFLSLIKTPTTFRQCICNTQNYGAVAVYQHLLCLLTYSTLKFYHACLWKIRTCTARAVNNASF